METSNSILYPVVFLCNELLRYITSSANVNVTSVEIGMDVYMKKSVKEGTRQQRGNKRGHAVHVLALQQNMVHGEAWKRFLSNNGDHKNTLISIFHCTKNEVFHLGFLQ